MLSDESNYHQIKNQSNLWKTKHTKQTKKPRQKDREANSVAQGHGLVVNEEALTHACPQYLAYTTSAWQSTVLV